MMGHREFDTLLCRINRVSFYWCASYHVVSGALTEEDSAAHTFVCCKAFDNERDTLVCEIESFNPSDWVLEALESPASWKAVVIFAEAVMSCKEEAVRARNLSVEGV